MTHQTAAALRALDKVQTHLSDAADDLQDGSPVLAQIRESQHWCKELAAVLTQEGADESKELKQALDLGDQLADWCNIAGPALKGMMDAYERRIRTDCTPEQLEKRPWECSEWLQARDALNKKPVAEIVFTVAAPAEPRAAEGAGTYEYQRLPTLEEQLRSIAAQQAQPTAAAAVPAGGDAFDKFFYSALDPRPEPAMLDGKVLPLGTAVLYGACGGDADKFWLATLAMRKAFEAGQVAPLPRGGVTEASAGFVEKALVTFAATYGPDELMQVSSAFLHRLCQITIQHAEQKLAEYDASKTPPAAQAQDAGPMARRRVFVDMDGVIVDFDKRKTELGMTGDEIKSLHGAYLDMEPLPGAIEAVRSVIGMGFDVWLATKPPTGVAHAYSDKAAWVFKHLPELKRKLVITHDKGMLGCERDVLIDDRPHKASCEKFRGTLIPFTNGKTWADVLAQLRALAAKEAK